MNKNRISVKDITIAALLAALALFIPMFMPIKLVLEPIFTATFASHVPGILAMFVGPFAVVGTAVGSALGFLQLGPWVSLRAIMHLVFGLIGYNLLKKNYNIFFVCLLSGIVHALAEMLVGFVSLPFVLVPNGDALKYILVTIGAGTFIHHLIDFVIAFIIFKALFAAKLLKININYKTFK